MSSGRTAALVFVLAWVGWTVCYLAGYPLSREETVALVLVLGGIAYAWRWLRRRGE